MEWEGADFSCRSGKEWDGVGKSEMEWEQDRIINIKVQKGVRGNQGKGEKKWNLYLRSGKEWERVEEMGVND